MSVAAAAFHGFTAPCLEIPSALKVQGSQSPLQFRNEDP